MRLEGRLICGMDIVHAVIDFGPIGTYINKNDYYTKDEIDADKQDKLVSGTNIKTINNQSLLGSGNINIQGGGGDMTNYYTKSETNSLLNAKQDTLTWDAVPTEDSDNPVTSGGLHTKFLYVETDLAGKANSADLAVVATSGDYDDLSNKPTIPAAQVQSNWNESDSSSKAYIQNKPTIPAAQVQSNWNESDTNSKAYIQNKPTVYEKPSGGIPSTDLANGVQTSLGKADASYCPIIEDTRSSADAVNITGTAPFATLAGGQRIVLHFKYANTASPTLQLTLSGGTTTSAYPLYQNYNNGVNALTLQAMPAGSYGEFVFDSTNSRWVLIGKDFNTTYSNTSQSDINNSAQGSRLIEPKLLRDNFYLKSEVNSICPIIEDTRDSAVDTITGIAPFSSLVDGQLIILHMVYYSYGNTSLQLTLSGGTITEAYPVYGAIKSGRARVTSYMLRDNTYVTLRYYNGNWETVGYLDTNDTFATLSQSELNTGTSTTGRVVPAKLLHDNAYIVEESYSSGSLKANKMYDFGTVSSALTIPSLDATNDLVSNALNFYALRFIAGADNLSITFPTGVQVDDEPTINTGDYVEIMINLYVVNSTNKFYGSIKVWPAQ